MLPSFLLALREGLEAALVIGVTLGILAKTGRNTLRPAVWRGVAAAVLLSLLVALTLQAIGAEFRRARRRDLRRRHHARRGYLAHLDDPLDAATRVFLTTPPGAGCRYRCPPWRRSALRRGFPGCRPRGAGAFPLSHRLHTLYGGLATLLGALLGLGAAAMLGYTLFATTRRLSLKRFFLVTNVLLVLFAAGLVAHGVHEFNEAGLIPPLIAPFGMSMPCFPKPRLSVSSSPPSSATTPTPRSAKCWLFRLISLFYGCW